MLPTAYIDIHNKVSFVSKPVKPAYFDKAI